MSNYYNDDSTKRLEEWLESFYDGLKRKDFLEKLDEKMSTMVKQAFLDGFSSGRDHRNKENWDLWNQK